MYTKCGGESFMSLDGRWIGEPRRGMEEEEAAFWRELGMEDILAYSRVV